MYNIHETLTLTFDNFKKVAPSFDQSLKFCSLLLANENLNSLCRYVNPNYIYVKMTLNSEVQSVTYNLPNPLNALINNESKKYEDKSNACIELFSPEDDTLSNGNISIAIFQEMIPKAIIYSLGKIFQDLFTNRYGDFTFPSTEIESLISKMTSNNPKERPDINTIAKTIDDVIKAEINITNTQDTNTFILSTASNQFFHEIAMKQYPTSSTSNNVNPNTKPNTSALVDTLLPSINTPPRSNTPDKSGSRSDSASPNTHTSSSTSSAPARHGSTTPSRQRFYESPNGRNNCDSSYDSSDVRSVSSGQTNQR